MRQERRPRPREQALDQAASRHSIRKVASGASSTGRAAGLPVRVPGCPAGVAEIVARAWPAALAVAPAVPGGCRAAQHEQDEGGDGRRREGVTESAAHDTAHRRPLAACRGDGRVRHRRDVVAEGGAREDRADEQRRLRAQDACGRVEQRRADEDRTKTRARGRREQDRDEEGQQHESAAAPAQLPPAHTRAWTRPDSRSRTENTPASSHAMTICMTMGRDMPRMTAAP